MALQSNASYVLSPLPTLIGTLGVDETTPTPLPGATWFTALAIGDGLAYAFPVGTLAAYHYLTFDLLLDDDLLTGFLLTLQEGEDGPVFEYIYAALDQCQARLRLPLEGVNQNRWQFPREGALLKPMCLGDRVDLRRVDRMTITVLRMTERPCRWCQTAVQATIEEPPLIDEPLLPVGPLLDEFGQYTLRDWSGKTHDEQELSERLQQQLADAPLQQWPEGFSRWGGWTKLRFDATGFFRTHHDGSRWWLVDPDGYAFWSAGLDCVAVNVNAAYAGLETALRWLPEPHGPFRDCYRQTVGRKSIDYLAANFRRVFGDDWHAAWATIALAQLRDIGFNTVANWSEWQIARDAAFPYVRPLNFRPTRTPLVFRDFPDVFAPSFAEDVAEYAAQLLETRDDPAFIGYFLMNEPTWGFTWETPAAGMLFTTDGCCCRDRLAGFLHERYVDDTALAQAWGMPVTFDRITRGRWNEPLTDAAKADLATFSTVMASRLFEELTQACKRVDPNHLNLGARYYTVPPDWVVDSMRCFDVFSMNCYRKRVPAEEYAALYTRLQRPILVGEWHFGALDAGLPASGIGRVHDQQARGQSYRYYVEDAAAQPWCVGTHYFTLYDESALGRFDGENWNIGFLDVCNHPYTPLVDAARVTHARLYACATRESTPFADPPEYLPSLFT